MVHLVKETRIDSSVETHQFTFMFQNIQSQGIYTDFTFFFTDQINAKF